MTIKFEIKESQFEEFIKILRAGLFYESCKDKELWDYLSKWCEEKAWALKVE